MCDNKNTGGDTMCLKYNNNYSGSWDSMQQL